MYEVYLEGAAERDLRRLPEEIFRRISPHIRSLAEDQDHQAVVSLPAREMIGGFGSAIIALFTKLTKLSER